MDRYIYIYINRKRERQRQREQKTIRKREGHSFIYSLNSKFFITFFLLLCLLQGEEV